MRKTFMMEDLDCAHCAAKMEAQIRALPGVKEATISFLAQKMVIEAEDERFDAIVKEAVAICKKIEPDCSVVL